MPYTVTRKCNEHDSFLAVTEQKEVATAAKDIFSQLGKTDDPVQVSLYDGVFVVFTKGADTNSEKKVFSILDKQLKALDLEIDESSQGMCNAILHKRFHDKDKSGNKLYQDWKPLEEVSNQSAKEIIDWFEKYTNSRVFRETPVYMGDLASYLYSSKLQPWQKEQSAEAQTLREIFALEKLNDYGISLAQHFGVGIPIKVSEKTEEVQTDPSQFLYKQLLESAKDWNLKEKPGATADKTSGKKVGTGEELTAGKGK